MSLYTPIFPSVQERESSRKGLSQNTSVAALPKQQSYAELLRDVHLFLSTHNDVLSPPSRPSSPLFDHRVQKLKNEIRDLFNTTPGQTPSGQWTRVSQTLKLGCVRGRPWSASTTNPYVPLEDTNWILPDEESEWIEWEKKREESRRLKGKTNTSQQIGDAPSARLGLEEPNHASVAKPSRSRATTRERRAPGVSPAIVRASKEKVRKWQASVAPQLWYPTASSSSPASTRAVAADGKIERPKRTGTLGFAVVKPAAKSIIGKGKGSLSRPVVRDGSAPTQSHKSKSPKPSKEVDEPEATVPVDVDESNSKQPLKTPYVKDDKPKIKDVPETPYLPPSFPAHLETSTPLADSEMLVRAKPAPIFPLPASSSTPPPSIPANPPEDHPLIPSEPHAADVSPFLPPQINTARPGKRSRGFSMSLEGIPDDPLPTPPAKRLRTLSQDPEPVLEDSKLMSPNEGLDMVLATGDGAQDPSLGVVPSHQRNTDTLEMVPLTPGKGDQLVTSEDARVPEKTPSPAKSIRSYFSAPDSDSADSPVKANLLLESPVSPMLSYAQNPNGFLPQLTSTQNGTGSPTVGRAKNGVFGMGYSSQFDVERYVDRVSELLEKDVDLDGWLRDVRTVETSQE